MKSNKNLDRRFELSSRRLLSGVPHFVYSLSFGDSLGTADPDSGQIYPIADSALVTRWISQPDLLLRCFEKKNTSPIEFAES